jgi:hypothetical protein
MSEDNQGLTGKQEILWRQYQLNVDLYKFYVETVVKLNVYFYAITGALASFYFAHPDILLLRYSLLLPLIMSIALCGLFLVGAYLARVPRDEQFQLRDALELQAAPDIGVLILLLYASAFVMLLVAAGVAYFIGHPSL